MAKVASKTAASTLTSEALFAACDHSRDLFLLIRGGKIVRGNRAWNTFVGADFGVEIRPLADFVTTEDKNALAAIGRGEVCQIEVTISPRAGVVLKGMLHAQPLAKGEALVVVRDLAEAYNPAGAEAALRAMAGLRDASLISLWRYNPV